RLGPTPYAEAFVNHPTDFTADEKVKLGYGRTARVFEKYDVRPFKDCVGIIEQGPEDLRVEVAHGVAVRVRGAHPLVVAVRAQAAPVAVPPKAEVRDPRARLQIARLLGRVPARLQR